MSIFQSSNNWMGLRNLELDAYSDKECGRFTNPRELELVDNLPNYEKMVTVIDMEFAR